MSFTVIEGNATEDASPREFTSVRSGASVQIRAERACRLERSKKCHQVP